MKIINWYLKIFPLSRFIVHGNSMLPTLKPDNSVLVFNWAYLFSKPKIGDLVVVRINGKDLVKRIQNIHDRKYFVLGDNKQICRCCGRKLSTDSRKFGWISGRRIRGKIVYVTK